jgi:MFS transporter, OFA family, oxalate/formate antiporter
MRKKIDQGFIVMFAGLGINLTLGVLYAWGIFSAALIDQMGWTATQTQIPYMIACAVFAFFMVPGGRLQDKFGPKPIIIVSAILAGIGFLLSGTVMTVIGLSIFFGLVFGIAMGLGYSAPTPAAIKWFCPSKRGLVSGIVVSGFGLAPIFIAPMTTAFIASLGIQNSFYVLGVLFFVAILILGQFVCNPPPHYKPKVSAVIKAKKQLPQKEFEIKEMLRTPQFYILWIMFCFGTFAGLLTIGQMSKIGSEQAGMESAFILISFYALFNFLGRILWGIISDKLGRKNSLFAIFLIQLITYVAFPFLRTPLFLLVGILLVGFTFGGMLTVFPSVTADYYGMRNFGFNYGIVFTAWGIGGVLGPLLGGIVRDLTGTYILSYGVSAILSFFGLLLSLGMKPPLEKPIQRQLEPKQSIKVST